jgi:fatty acid desaturase
MMVSGREATPSEVAALLHAAAATSAAIQRRARIYRWAVFGIVLALIVPILIALVSLSWRPVPCVVMLVPVVAVLLVIDSRTVLEWQRRVLHMWIAGDFRLSGFRSTIEGMRHLPTETVKGMLGRLPTSEPPHNLDQLSAAAKASAAEICLERDRRQGLRTLLSAIGATLLACSVGAAISIQVAPLLLVGLVGLALIESSRRVR